MKKTIDRDMEKKILAIKQKYIVKSYGEDLVKLTELLIKMGKMVVHSIIGAVTVLETGNRELAEKIIKDDVYIDRLENKIDNFSVQILALRQPVAQDLRHVITSLKIASHLERIADYAEHIANRQSSLDKNYKMHQLDILFKLGELVSGMLVEVMHAFIERDDKKANSVWDEDDKVDLLYTKFIKDQLKYISKHPEDTNNSIHLMIMAKNLERMGDHVTNIAENIHYLVHGTLWADSNKEK